MALFTFVDGNQLERIESKHQYIPGCCDTCDFGSRYINEILIVTTHYKLYVRTVKEFDYAISEALCMKVCLSTPFDLPESFWLKKLEKNFKETIKQATSAKFVNRGLKTGKVIIKRIKR